MTMSQIPDVNRELAEVGAMFAMFRALTYEPACERARLSLEGA